MTRVPSKGAEHGDDRKVLRDEEVEREAARHRLDPDRVSRNEWPWWALRVVPCALCLLFVLSVAGVLHLPPSGFVLVTALVLIWCLGVGLVRRAAVTRLSERVADGLTGFNQRPVFPPDVHTPHERAPDYPLVELDEPDDARAHVDCRALARALAVRIAVVADAVADEDAPAVIISLGTATLRTDVSVDRYRLEPSRRAVLLACLSVAGAVRVFLTQELGRNWPSRPSYDPLAIVSGPVRPLARIEDGAILLGYEDDLGPVLLLDPIPLDEVLGREPPDEVPAARQRPNDEEEPIR